MPAFVKGLELIAPQAVAFVTEEATVGDVFGAPQIVAVIGPADGGKPQEFVELHSYSEAQAMLRSGVLLDILRKIYNPAAGVQGAFTTRVYRVNAGTQSTRNLVDTTPATVVSLATRDYGVHTNQVRTKVEAGTTAGYKATVQGYDGAAAQVEDNITRTLLTIRYTGAGSAATVAITATELTTVVTGGAAQESATFTFATSPTIQALADAIVATGGYSVTVNADPKTLSTTLDAKAAGSVMSNTALTANVQALVDWYNNSEPFILATRVTGNAIVTSANFLSLTGGSNGAAVTTTDYQNGLNALQGEEAQIVVVCSTDAAVHAMADAHCTLMSQPGANKERIAIVGGAAGETVDAAIARARAISSFRTALVYPGLIELDTASNPTTLSPMYAAAAVAGIMAGLRPGVPGTRKPVRMVGPEKKISPTDIRNLLRGGVLPIEAHADEGARIVQSILTLPQPSQVTPSTPLKYEISARLAADTLVSRIRARLDAELIGGIGGPLLRENAKSITQSMLAEAERDGLIVGDADRPAYRDISATIQGDVIIVGFAASIATPGNYVVLNASLTTFS